MFRQEPRRDVLHRQLDGARIFALGDRGENAAGDLARLPGRELIDPGNALPALPP